MDPANTEDCHWIKTGNGSSKSDTFETKRYARIQSVQKQLKGMHLSFLGRRGKVYFTDSFLNIN